ncbi:MAG TPA: NmrA family NAD(P)-binding protein [Candidatus Saccharimonadales bacterium]|jgi:uncharacterized protein YbjT (DUF2867 family)|nr:NmrA family NAD(P)-binding protein [Candidatus Saccharimonadales bacterium]
MIVVTGATGHTGSVTAEALLAAGAKVRVIGRDSKKLERFTAMGAEAFVADMTNAAVVEKAFSGARAVFVVIPPNIAAPDIRAYQGTVRNSLTSAIQKNKITYAVVVSSTGAEQSGGTGVVLGLHDLEKKFEEIAGLNFLCLRCGYFMENLLPQIGILQSFGFLAGPLRADLPLPMIATRDIARVAAGSLLKLDFIGKQTRELLGPKHLEYSEAAKIIGGAIGKPDLSYRQVPALILKPAMMRLGMSSSVVNNILEMCDALNSGKMKSLEPRSALNTTPTTLEQFAAEVFAAAYAEKAAGA